MPERIDHDELPQATLVPRRRARISVVWIIPILAALVAIAIAVQHILSQGPTITIVFKAGAGWKPARPSARSTRRRPPCPAIGVADRCRRLRPSISAGGNAARVS